MKLEVIQQKKMKQKEKTMNKINYEYLHSLGFNKKEEKHEIIQKSAEKGKK